MAPYHQSSWGRGWRRFAVQDAAGHSMAFFHFTNRPDAADSAIDLFKRQALRRAAKYAGPMLRDGDG
jgi:hypothetical protein